MNTRSFGILVGKNAKKEMTSWADWWRIFCWSQHKAHQLSFLLNYGQVCIGN